VGTRTTFAFDFVQQGAKVSFNDCNYIVLEDVGRITRTNLLTSATEGMTFGKFIRLHVCRDEHRYDVDPVNPAYDKDDTRYPLISPQVREIRYRNKDAIWIISRQGHRGDSAILFDIVKGKVLLHYSGVGFCLSPDGQKIAFYHDANHDFQIIAFVNDVMVYPFKESFDWPPRNPPRTKAGVLYDEFVKEAPDSAIETPIIWKDQDTIQFTVREYPATQPRVLGREPHRPDEPGMERVQCIVSDLRTSDTAINIGDVHVKQSVLPNK